MPSGTRRSISSTVFREEMKNPQREEPILGERVGRKERRGKPPCRIRERGLTEQGGPISRPLLVEKKSIATL